MIEEYEIDRFTDDVQLSIGSDCIRKAPDSDNLEFTERLVTCSVLNMDYCSRGGYRQESGEAEFLER